MKKTLLLLPLLLCTACIIRHPVNNISMLTDKGATIPTLVGHASSTTWFWTWTTGDSSYETAQKNGGIATVTSITRTTNSLFGLIVVRQVTVRGE